MRERRKGGRQSPSNRLKKGWCKGGAPTMKDRIRREAGSPKRENGGTDFQMDNSPPIFNTKKRGPENGSG
jgi:hypothetical protein